MREYISTASCTYSGPPWLRISLDELPNGTGTTTAYRRFDKLGDRIYFEDGSVMLVSPEKTLDILDTVGHGQFYSQRTPEQHKAAREKTAKEKADYEAEVRRCNKIQAEKDRQHRALLKSARRKLTRAEYQAVYDEGYQAGGDY